MACVDRAPGGRSAVARRVLGTSRQKVMVNGLFTQTNYQGLKKMLDATVLRHEAIASNMANLETPNYKRIDVESNFGEELSRAVAARDAREIARLQPRIVMDKNAVSPNRDGNTVQLEKELVAMQQNTLNHTMQTQFLSSSLMKLRSAIQGRNA
ncbi:MAG: flagellar basal body rod protein FlgB [Verrucomicrobia bacterium]|nr:flagellar basal body rod protein FlgB [Verrucomicrobiota bacterium]